ncbi:MAG: hypothetical protein HYW57_08380 [Ignavibacteriales bacterium]|nr:hypothetical protein [Ignavibacteriales bacterium]
MKKGVVLAAAAFFMFPVILAGQEREMPDSTIVFQPIRPELIRQSSYSPPSHAWGFDIMISNNGFGAGGFYRHQFSGVLSGIATLAISDVKDDAEVEYFDYFGNSFVPGKKNRLLMIPLIFGAQYRLFKDDIMDNFRPYLSAGLGPTMMFVAPYAYTRTTTGPSGEQFTDSEEVEFFSSLKYGQARYTVGGFLSAGAYFGAPYGTLMGLSFRYYLVPFPKGIEIIEGTSPVKNFGGFYITLNIGSFY